MTDVVTGAAGHVGANLVRELLRRGREVRALVHHDGRALAGLDVERIRGDISDLESLERVCAGADVVYHLAAQVAVAGARLAEMGDVNVAGTRNVVAACLRAGVARLVHVGSSQACRREPGQSVVDETCRLADTGRCSPYDRSKALAEREVRIGVERGLDAVVALPTGIVGPHDYKPSQMGEVLWAMARGRLPALVVGAYDWVDVRDVADGLIAMAEQGRLGERYLLTGQRCSLVELAEHVQAVTGRRAPRWAAPHWLALAAAPAAEAAAHLARRRPLFTREALRILSDNSHFSPAKAEAELGYVRRPIRDTIADTIEWFEQRA